MAEAFNIERFMEASGRLDLSDIDWSDVPKHPITPAGLRAIRYFLLTEGSTFFYVKTLMTTGAAIEEPEMAPFLSVWMYEEEYHGRAFRRFLEAYGEPPPATYRQEMFAARGPGERIDEISQTLLSRIFPNDWPAVHMVWGVIQEYTTYCGYQGLIERINHPQLNVICQRIMKQELRHYAFYREHAKKRLVRSTNAQRIASVALKLGWTPVGDGMCSKEDVVHAIQFLFDGPHNGVARRIEEKIRELPGLEWFDLFTKFCAQHKIGHAPSSWYNSRRVSNYQEALAAP